MKKLSVIIPSYNYADVLGRAVNSIPDTDEIEILIIDDGSPDNTEEIASELVNQRSNLKYIKKENGGAASARNRGIKEATGEYLFFLDADDEASDNAFEKILDLIKKQNPELIIGEHISISPDGKQKVHKTIPLSNNPEERLKLYFDKKIPIMHGSFAAKKSCFDKISYPENFKNAEDIPVFAQLITNFQPVMINHPLFKLYKHDDSLRNNTEHTKAAGLELVEYVFDPKIMPENIQHLKPWYTARRALSVFRSLLIAGEKKEARKYYKTALKIQPSLALRPKFLKKYLTSFF